MNDGWNGGGLTLTQIKADPDIADALTKKHASGSDNQDLSALAEKSEIPVVTIPLGHLSGLTVSRKDNDEIYISGGSIEMGGVLYNLDAQLAVAPGGEPTGYGSDACSGGTASAKDYIPYIGMEPLHAFDDNPATKWHMGDHPGVVDNWLQYQFASAKRIQKITIRAARVQDFGDPPTKQPFKSWVLKGSNTGAFAGEEVTIHTVSNGETYSASEVKTFTFANANSYIFNRVVATEMKAGTSYYVIAEMEMSEASYTLSASTPYYVYADPPGSGVELAVGNFIISATAPSFDSAKGGWYHPTNTDQRAICTFTTDGDGHVPTAPFVHYQPLPAVSSGAQLLSVTNLPLNADGETTIYTVPAGVRCVLSYAILVAGADAGSTDLTIGADGAETDWLGTQQLDNLDAENDAVILMPVPNATPVKIKSYAAATVIKAAVANHAGGATNTLYLYGMLY